MLGPELVAYRDLTIHIRNAGKGMAEVRLDGPDGEVEGALRLPIDPWDVEQALGGATRAPQKAWVQRSAPVGAVDPLKEIGRVLFAALFEGRREVAYRRALDQAAYAQEGLRLVFDTKDEEIAGLPWEFLHDGVDFVGMSERTPVVRGASGAGEPAPAGGDELRLLVMIGGALSEVDVDAHLDPLKELAGRDAGARLSVVPGGGGMEALEQALREFQPNALHVLGHGAGTGGEQSLVLDGPGAGSYSLRGSGLLVSGRMFSRLLAGAGGLRLIAFCGANTESLAYQIARQAPMLRAVVGTRAQMTSRTSLAFVSGMYRSLMGQSFVSAAITRGRQEADQSSPGSREWGLPVVYVRGPETRLLQAPQAEAYVPKGVSATLSPPKDPETSREWSKLLSLRQMYEQTLATLTEQVNRGKKAPYLIEMQVKQTQERIDDLDRRMQEMDAEDA